MIHFHVRAFFWELTAVFDAVVRWAYKEYALRADSFYDLKWAKLYPQESAVDGWKMKRDQINTIWTSDWFFEVRTYRNYSHESYLRQDALGTAVRWGRGQLYSLPAGVYAKGQKRTGSSRLY